MGMKAVHKIIIIGNFAFKKVGSKNETPTMAIRNAGGSADMKVITLNKLSAKLKGKCLEIPHYA